MIENITGIMRNLEKISKKNNYFYTYKKIKFLILLIIITF